MRDKIWREKEEADRGEKIRTFQDREGRCLCFEGKNKGWEGENEGDGSGDTWSGEQQEGAGLGKIIV